MEWEYIPMGTYVVLYDVENEEFRQPPEWLSKLTESLPQAGDYIASNDTLYTVKSRLYRYVEDDDENVEDGPLTVLLVAETPVESYAAQVFGEGP